MQPAGLFYYLLKIFFKVWEKKMQPLFKFSLPKITSIYAKNWFYLCKKLVTFASRLNSTQMFKCINAFRILKKRELLDYNYITLTFNSYDYILYRSLDKVTTYDVFNNDIITDISK